MHNVFFVIPTRKIILRDVLCLSLLFICLSVLWLLVLLELLNSSLYEISLSLLPLSCCVASVRDVRAHVRESGERKRLALEITGKERNHFLQEKGIPAQITVSLCRLLRLLQRKRGEFSVFSPLTCGCERRFRERDIRFGK